MERVILHVDVNNAFLSWTAVNRLKNGETLDIRTIPAIIGGDEKQRKGVLGEDGLIRQAEKAKDHKANGIAYDEALVESLDDKIANAVAEPPVKMTEEFLKEKLSKESGDSAIDEYGNIVSLSLWNTEPIDSTTCEIAGWSEGDIYSYEGTIYAGYKGEIKGGQIEGNIPVFVKKNNTIYKVTSIGDSAFSGCSGLTSITIPDSVTSIGYGVFYYCSNLTTVTIDSSTIASSITSYSSGGYLLNTVTTIYIKNTIPEESIGSYIISNYNEVETKDGYVKYTIKTSN